jgi:hypothetical protein
MSHGVHINAHRFTKKCFEEAYKCLGKGVVLGGEVGFFGGGGLIFLGPIREGSVW